MFQLSEYLLKVIYLPSKLQEILAEVTKSLQQTNPDYALVLEVTLVL